MYFRQAHDVKFQTQNSEEKEAWINALSDGIGRAKNKVFDEVNFFGFWYWIVSSLLEIRADNIRNVAPVQLCDTIVCGNSISATPT